jgi:hypothetical protein
LPLQFGVQQSPPEQVWPLLHGFGHVPPQPLLAPPHLSAQFGVQQLPFMQV